SSAPRRTPPAGCACTTTCSMPSPPTASATAPTGTSPAEKAETQLLRLADQAPRRDETQDGERPYQELSAIRVSDRSRLRRLTCALRSISPPWGGGQPRVTTSDPGAARDR